MKKLFEISSEEKQRILEMHENATKKNYLSETSSQTTKDGQPVGTVINGVTYKLQGLTEKNINQFLNNNFLVCEWFDPNIDFKKSGWGVECHQEKADNPCCNLKWHIKNYLTTLAKSFTTPADFVKYPFSKYIKESEKGKVMARIWTDKMKTHDPNYVATQPLPSPQFDNIVFGLILNGENLPKSGLAKVPGTYNW